MASLQRVTLVVVLAACQQTPQDVPKPKPTPTNVCPTYRPAQGVACSGTPPRCAYVEWTCECAAGGHWMCSTCIAPDNRKPCVPGAHGEQHNWERDEWFTCDDDGTWACSSSTSNSASCAGFHPFHAHPTH